jgi:hypothetical protein
MESITLFHVALSALRQGSGVHTRRKVVAKSVYQGIVTRAAINGILRLPLLLRPSAGPSLRRAVTAPWQQNAFLRQLSTAHRAMEKPIIGLRWYSISAMPGARRECSGIRRNSGKRPRMRGRF